MRKSWRPGHEGGLSIGLLTTFLKLHKLLLITYFYPAAYLIEENNQLPDLYTIGNLTGYTIVLFAPIVVEARFC